MKPFLFLSAFVLLLSGCETKKKPEEMGIVPGQIFGTKWFFTGTDTLLWVYSVYDTKHQELSRTSRSGTSTYSHENSAFTVFKVQGSTLKYMYQKEASCINHVECGTRYTDKIIAHSSDLLAFQCFCEGKTVYIEIATGKEWANGTNLKDKFPELDASIVELNTFPSHPDVIQYSLSNGKVIMISLETKKVVEWDKSFDGTIEVEKGTTRWLTTDHQNIYFDKNDDDNRCFLVVRSLKSGTSQNWKYKTGENYWLNPIFVNRINSADGYFKDDAFFVLHAAQYNEALETDLLSKVNNKGENIFTISLQGLGRIWTYFISDHYIYVGLEKGMRIYDVQTGKEVQKIVYRDLKK